MEWIDEVIMGLLDLYGTRNVYELYDALEISMVKLPEDNVMLQGNEGIYLRDYLDGESVYIRDDLDPEYEEFVLAHELGHALLHTDIHTNFFNGIPNRDKLDRQANYFAIKLLDFEGRLDSIALEGFTIEQIASTLSLPMMGLAMIKEMQEIYSA
ncbi:ImmA/IrrE family metallo-endopeptidase [Natronincola ferrireducens]|nr:ImmA/IrrE family metallo-endopeptidase [Natronincola ferrireducens]